MFAIQSTSPHIRSVLSCVNIPNRNDKSLCCSLSHAFHLTHKPFTHAKQKAIPGGAIANGPNCVANIVYIEEPYTVNESCVSSVNRKSKRDANIMIITITNVIHWRTLRQNDRTTGQAFFMKKGLATC